MNSALHYYNALLMTSYCTLIQYLFFIVPLLLDQPSFLIHYATSSVAGSISMSVVSGLSVCVELTGCL